jgi:hypothetical protein
LPNIHNFTGLRGHDKNINLPLVTKPLSGMLLGDVCSCFNADYADYCTVILCTDERMAFHDGLLTGGVMELKLRNMKTGLRE